MFNFDQAVSEWRQQMIAGGVKAHEVLEELESHLRDDVEQQARSGMGQQQAFGDAMQRIGERQALKKEFCKVSTVVAKRHLFGCSGFTHYTLTKKRIGAGLVVVTLLAAVVLQLVGASLVGKLRVIHRSGTATLIDSSWQIRWYAFALAGLLVAGIVLTALPGQEKRDS
jgi:hypothetical protein